MAIRVSIEGAEELSGGIWRAQVSSDELAVFAGRPDQRGSRSVILVSGELIQRDGRLEFEPAQATVLNVGSTMDTIFVASPQAEATPAEVAAVSNWPDIYWVTVGDGRQANLEIAINAGEWGVPETYANRLDGVGKGDYVLFYGSDVGFALSRVESDRYASREPRWPDGAYPHRIRISKPLLANNRLGFSDVYACLLDRRGLPYRSGQAGGRGIGGPGGIFRRLQPREIVCLFDVLGWENLKSVEGL